MKPAGKRARRKDPQKKHQGHKQRLGASSGPARCRADRDCHEAGDSEVSQDPRRGCEGLDDGREFRSTWGTGGVQVEGLSSSCQFLGYGPSKQTALGERDLPHLATPNRGDVRQLRRLGRHLVGHPGAVLKCQFQGEIFGLVAHADGREHQRGSDHER